MQQMRAETNIKGINQSHGNLGLNSFQARSNTFYGASKGNSNGFKKWTKSEANKSQQSPQKVRQSAAFSKGSSVPGADAISNAEFMRIFGGSQNDLHLLKQLMQTGS